MPSIHAPKFQGNVFSELGESPQASVIGHNQPINMSRTYILRGPQIHLANGAVHPTQSRKGHVRLHVLSRKENQLEHTLCVHVAPKKGLFVMVVATA
jgi:hypothetical protein